MPATADSWKRQPFVEEIAISYAREFSAEELARLREGLVPVAMEDKWFVYFEAPYLYFHRSWTGQPVYRIALAPKDDGGATVTEALWDPSGWRDKDPTYPTALLDFLVAFHLLGEPRSFPLPLGIADAKSAMMFRHSVGGYRQTPPVPKAVPPKRPWWKFWR